MYTYTHTYTYNCLHTHMHTYNSILIIHLLVAEAAVSAIGASWASRIMHWRQAAGCAEPHTPDTAGAGRSRSCRRSSTGSSGSGECSVSISKK